MMTRSTVAERVARSECAVQLSVSQTVNFEELKALQKELLHAHHLWKDKSEFLGGSRVSRCFIFIHLPPETTFTQSSLLAALGIVQIAAVLMPNLPNPSHQRTTEGFENLELQTVETC